MKYLFFVMFLVSCAHTPIPGVYNRNLEQDGKCYSSYGGHVGYCDKAGK